MHAVLPCRRVAASSTPCQRVAPPPQGRMEPSTTRPARVRQAPSPTRADNHRLHRHDAAASPAATAKGRRRRRRGRCAPEGGARTRALHRHVEHERQDVHRPRHGLVLALDATRAHKAAGLPIGVASEALARLADSRPTWWCSAARTFVALNAQAMLRSPRQIQSRRAPRFGWRGGPRPTGTTAAQPTVGTAPIRRRPTATHRPPVPLPAPCAPPPPPAAGTLSGWSWRCAPTHGCRYVPVRVAGAVNCRPARVGLLLCAARHIMRCQSPASPATSPATSPAPRRPPRRPRARCARARAPPPIPRTTPPAAHRGICCRGAARPGVHTPHRRRLTRAVPCRRGVDLVKEAHFSPRARRPL